MKFIFRHSDLLMFHVLFLLFLAFFFPFEEISVLTLMFFFGCQHFMTYEKKGFIYFLLLQVIAAE